MPSTSVIALDLGHVGIAACLILVCGVASVWLGLGLERTLFVASVRTVAQLLLVGYILRWVFHLDNPLLVVVLLVIMAALAAHAAVERSPRRYDRIALDTFLTLVLAGFVTTFTVTGFVVQVQPWYRPQYVVPLMGMVLGSTLTGVSLSLDSLLVTLVERRGEVEVELCHGATAWEAVRAPIAESVRRGLIPTLNGMMVVGIVTLPGMMTGQVLAGVDPLVAVRYQIVVMFALAAANTLGCLGITCLAFRHLFNEQHQLRYEKITSRI